MKVKKTDLYERSEKKFEEEEEINHIDNEVYKISDEESSYESDDEQIKKLLLEKINNIQINDLKKMFIKKRKNKEKEIKDIVIKNKKIINSSLSITFG